jgi:hypothetical protein
MEIVVLTRDDVLCVLSASCVLSVLRLCRLPCKPLAFRCCLSKFASGVAQNCGLDGKQSLRGSKAAVH